MKKVMSSVNWSYYDNPIFDRINDEYLPDRGEGDTKATQLVTVLNKLIYKWYNDGDVFDNNYGMEGWANDLSSYANWMYNYVPESKPILNKIKNCFGDGDYELLLKDLADTFFDEELLEKFNSQPAIGSIYDCDEPFSFTDWEEEDEGDLEEDYWEEDEDEEDW